MMRCVEVPARASVMMVVLARRLEQDADRAGHDAQRRRRDASERLWDGVHPDGLAAVYGEHPGAIDAAAGCSRTDTRNANVHGLAAAAGSS